MTDRDDTGGWGIHDPSNKEVAEIVMRRFGSDHDKPCARPTITTCAQWNCQVRDRCVHAPIATLVV